MDSPAHNPYAPPSADITPDTPSGAEQVRKANLSHETSIQAIGSLYLFSAIFLTLATIGLAITGLFQVTSSGFDGLEGGGSTLMISILYAVLAAISWYLGRGLRRLDPKVKTGATILAVFGLLGFPFGTLINLYVLYLLHSAKGKQVLSTEYQAIVEATPAIQYRTPLWLKLIALLFVALLVLAIVMAALQS